MMSLGGYLPKALKHVANFTLLVDIIETPQPIDIIGLRRFSFRLSTT